jgi:hypothetical protein
LSFSFPTGTRLPSLAQTRGRDKTVFRHLPTKRLYFPFPTVNRSGSLGYPYISTQHGSGGPDKGIFLFGWQNHATLAYPSNSQQPDHNLVTLRLALPDCDPVTLRVFHNSAVMRHIQVSSYPSPWIRQLHLSVHKVNHSSLTCPDSLDLSTGTCK